MQRLIILMKRVAQIDLCKRESIEYMEDKSSCNRDNRDFAMICGKFIFERSF
jgi:hypothetical protein